jgi:hypothetical protein
VGLTAKLGLPRRGDGGFCDRCHAAKAVRYETPSVDTALVVAVISGVIALVSAGFSWRAQLAVTDRQALRDQEALSRALSEASTPTPITRSTSPD